MQPTDYHLDENLDTLTTDQTLGALLTITDEMNKINASPDADLNRPELRNLIASNVFSAALRHTAETATAILTAATAVNVFDMFSPHPARYQLTLATEYADGAFTYHDRKVASGT